MNIFFLWITMSGLFQSQQMSNEKYIYTGNLKQTQTAMGQYFPTGVQAYSSTGNI